MQDTNPGPTSGIFGLFGKVVAALHAIRNGCPNCGSAVDVAIGDVETALAIEAGPAPGTGGAGEPIP